MESVPAARAAEQEVFGNRKLIRPVLNRVDHNHMGFGNHMPATERRERGERPDRQGGKKVPPPETTNAENFYYQKQMQSKTPMVVVLRDGEQVHGVIEWYDRNCIKLVREGGPNIVVYKPAIKYLYKESEGNGHGG
jgi:sRNA-binding regulator protein Hfq